MPKSFAASGISIQLSKPGTQEQFTVSLQHFMDMIGASQIFNGEKQYTRNRPALHAPTRIHVDDLSGSEDPNSPDDISASRQSPTGEPQVIPSPPAPMLSSSMRSNSILSLSQLYPANSQLERHISAMQEQQERGGLPSSLTTCNAAWKDEKQTHSRMQDSTNKASLKKLKNQYTKEMVKSLDQLLPDEFRGEAKCNHAGAKRSFGAMGRTLTDVLEDVVR